jgi:hypothetical protein
VELPFAIDPHSAVADVADGEDGHGIRICRRLQGLYNDCGVAQGQHE